MGLPLLESLSLHNSLNDRTTCQWILVYILLPIRCKIHILLKVSIYMISIRNTSLNMFEYVISIIDEQWFQLSANNVWVNPQVLFPTTVNIEVSSHDLLSHNSEIYTVPSTTTTTTSFEIRTCQQTCQANLSCLTEKEVGFGAKQLSLEHQDCSTAWLRTSVRNSQRLHQLSSLICAMDRQEAG